MHRHTCRAKLTTPDCFVLHPFLGRPPPKSSSPLPPLALARAPAVCRYVGATGPLSICVDASSWQTYRRGVLKRCGDQIDHCVQAVGIQTEAGTWKGTRDACVNGACLRAMPSASLPARPVAFFG